MAKAKLKDDEAAMTTEDIKGAQVTNSPQPFTGIARSVECFNYNGFRNFKILTLHIEHGMVMKIERSDAYANFECISRMELQNEISIMTLNNNWREGMALSK